MKRCAFVFALVVALVVPFLAGSAAAASRTPTPAQVVRGARATIVVPVEWDGVWTSVDSTYDCLGAFESTDASADTICGGKDYSPDSGGSPITFQCTGSATATTFQQSCTASFDVVPDCTATYTLESHGTRSGDTYFMVSTMSVSYSGTGTGCNFFPSSCTQVNSHGTRTGPAPTAYCATPTLRPSWGQLKSVYR